jgi:endoglucanase
MTRATWRSSMLGLAAVAVLVSACGGGGGGGGPRGEVPPADPWATSPVEAYGRLQVCENRICSAGDVPVQLRGMSLFWSNTGWGAEKFYNADLVNNLADHYDVAVIRAAIGAHESGGYLANPSANLSRARTIIDAAIAKGMYVIVDWHSHQLLQEKAQEFFGTLAAEYATAENVIWETFNEPPDGNYSWSQLKAYHEAVIETIRDAGSANLVVVGSPTWSQDVDVAAADPITSDANVAYTLHFYAGTHRQPLRDKADVALEAGLALFVTEYGTVEASGNGGFYPVESRAWLDWMDANQISSANWSMNDKVESASALRVPASASGPWGSGDLTESGAFVLEYVRAGYVEPTPP